jgi:hypothetical protein
MRPMLRWFVFTVGFGLLPFGFSILLAALETGSVMPADGRRNCSCFR